MSSMMVQARDQMSDAVDAPCSWITSGATVDSNGVRWNYCEWYRELTPVGSTVDFLDVLAEYCVEVERDTEIGELDISILRTEDVGSCNPISSVNFAG